MTPGRLRWRQLLRGAAFMLGVAVRLVFWPTFAAGVVAAIIERLNWLQAAWAWVVAAPLLYAVWLVVLLGCYALETTLLRNVLGKPGRLVISERSPYPLSVTLIFALYFRIELLMSLPGARMLKALPGFRVLWYRAYSPRTHLGYLSVIRGTIYDPDLTFIGRGALVGEETRLVAHSVVRQPQGDLLMHTAPIRIGRYATVGGGCQVEMGVRIGAGALIEPRSHVLAFTRVPAGEVWGGAPAVFRRKRDQAAFAGRPAIPRAADGNLLLAVLPVVARALSFPAGEIRAESGAANCVVWDSVGQMAIAAALHDRFGISLTVEELVHVDSVAAVLRLLEARQVGVRGGVGGKAICAELLPLLDPAEASAALAARDPEPMKSRLRICIAASFVAEPLAPTLKLWCGAFGIDAEIEFAPFDQLPAALLSPEGLFQKHREGLHVVLTRPEDFPSEAVGDVELSAGALFDAIESYLGRPGATLAVGDLPPSISKRERQNDTESLRTLWRNRIGRLPSVELVSFGSTIDDLGVSASRGENAGSDSMPYSAVVYQRLGIAISRVARRRCVPAKKVAAVDADGVLWDGVVGEDGSENVRVDGPFLQVQQTLLRWKSEGAVLVLVSQNEPGDVWGAFAAHPEMPLRREDFAAVAVNWKRKSENLRGLAGVLNLGLDAFVFIDDNPAQQLEVQSACPEVTVLPLPRDGTGAAQMLERLWCFDASRTTPEDGSRTDMMRTEFERQATARSAASFADYLHSLELRIDVGCAEESDLPRVAQLIAKTNQFNLSLRRRTLAEVEAVAANQPIWIVSARDRFGDYGTVGVAILEAAHGAREATLETFLVSCRALGRGIEEAFLYRLGEAARGDGAIRLLAPYVEGPRNGPMRDFLIRQGWQPDASLVFSRAISDLTPIPAHVRWEQDAVPTGA